MKKYLGEQFTFTRGEIIVGAIGLLWLFKEVGKDYYKAADKAVNLGKYLKKEHNVSDEDLRKISEGENIKIED